MTAVAGEALDPLVMRRTMGRFATGVGVVTTLFEGEPHGMTVNSLTSVSLEPPLLLVCLGSGARTTEAMRASGRFGVSILSARQDEIALRFARRGADHFAGLPLRFGEHEVPVVPDALAHLECVTERQFVAGDHDVFIGAVRRVCDREGEPLAYLGGRMGDYRGRDEEPIHWFA
ncbi:flavin reductase family protein [Sciscionella marina]|uniref:flavin reductase family protein n=1 Tax=Sciscionella marina TaxID=508770 RepID=UPI000364BB19|nr:flavin reductase family protein [Sciscionella marina]